MPPVPASDHASPIRESISGSRFTSLRGVRWRIDLGILPKSPASIDDIRRVAADSRRRYAHLRRRLIVDPHLSKDESKSPDLIVDNPLSQSPDSLWSLYFRNAELEKMLDQDLSRLYPDQEGYFQTATCQAMLRQILLLWCLIHPECGYRQGMHELLAPLLYVLHIDLQYLSQVRDEYEDYFSDEFHGVSLPEIELSSAYRFEKIMNMNTAATDKDGSVQEKSAKVRSLDELDPETKDIFLMSDAYGVEGELGVVLSEKFMEHDAYCMFDYLMNDANSVVVMAELFSPSPSIGSSTGLPPIIEASSAMYQLLSIIDSSLHSHLVELGVEPQYFALRWLRLLFGREFSLEDLLVVWDEIFSFPNLISFPDKANESELGCRILCSPRGAFILAMAVSMLLQLRSSILATEYATACLQRLLNLPEDISVKKLIEKAKSLQSLALDTVFSCSSQGGIPGHQCGGRRGQSLSYGSSPVTPNLLSDSYWEEKWRLLHAAEELDKENCGDTVSSDMADGPLIERFNLPRTASDPCPTEFQSENKNVGPSDTSTGVDRNHGIYRSDKVPRISATDESLCLEREAETDYVEEHIDQDVIVKGLNVAEESRFNADNSLSTATSPHRMVNDHEYDSEDSSITSSSLIGRTCDETNSAEKPCNASIDKEENSITSSRSGQGPYSVEKQAGGLKKWKPLSGRFQWLRRFNRGYAEGNMGNRIAVEPQKSHIVADNCGSIYSAPASDPCHNSFEVSRNIEDEDKNVTGTSGDPCHSSFEAQWAIEDEDKNVAGNLRGIAKAMLENIQVIESIFKQDQGLDGSKDSKSTTISGDGQVAAMAALEELRNISNFLSECDD
ncbi:unnamed protein product [Musa hybrid cultivar]